MAGESDPPSGPVDVSLIEEMLRLDPEQRLLLNDRMIQTIQELRDAFAREPDHAAAAPVHRGG